MDMNVEIRWRNPHDASCRSEALSLSWSPPFLLIPELGDTCPLKDQGWYLLHCIDGSYLSESSFPVLLKLGVAGSREGPLLFISEVNKEAGKGTMKAQCMVKIEPLPFYLMSPIKVLLLTPSFKEKHEQAQQQNGHLRIATPVPENVFHQQLLGQPLPWKIPSLALAGMQGHSMDYEVHIHSLWSINDDDIRMQPRLPPLALKLRQWGGFVTSATMIMVQGQTCHWLAPVPSSSVSHRCFEAHPQSYAELCLRLRAALGNPPKGDNNGGCIQDLLRRRSACRTILVEGPAGSGKTSLIEAAARNLGLFIVHIRPGDLMASYDVEADDALDKSMEATKTLAPAILLIDNVDLLVCMRDKVMATKGEIDHAMERWLRRLEDDNTDGIAVIMTAREGWRGGVGNHQLVKISLAPPDTSGRATLLSHLLEGHIEVSKEMLTQISYACQGFALGELIALTKRAKKCMVGKSARLGGKNNEAMWREALERALAEGRRLRLSAGTAIPVTKVYPSISWSDVGGLRVAKEALKEMITLPMSHPQAFARLGIRPPTGLLLYGPPGTGKTLLAKASACQTGAGFLPIRISDIVRGEIGTAEIKLRDAFRAALKSRPVIIFIDEFQALFTSRTHGGGGGLSSGGRLASQLLQSMDEVSTRTKGDIHEGGYVAILAATNSPEAIDPAFLRPGRFDRLIYASLPDLEDRLEILEGLRSKMRWNPALDTRALAEQTEGFSGADLSNLLRHAALHALSSGDDTDSLPYIKSTDIDKAMEVCRATTSPTSLLKYENFCRSHQ